MKKTNRKQLRYKIQVKNFVILPVQKYYLKKNLKNSIHNKNNHQNNTPKMVKILLSDLLQYRAKDKFNFNTIIKKRKFIWTTKILYFLKMFKKVGLRLT